MIAWPVLIIAFLRLAAVVTAVPQFLRREEICISFVTSTLTVTSTASSEPSSSSSISPDDVLTILITSTITVTSTIRYDSSQASQTSPATTLNRPSPSSNPSGISGSQGAVTTQIGPGGVTVTVISTVISVSTETLVQTQTIIETAVGSGSVSATVASSDHQITSNSESGATVAPVTPAASSETVVSLQPSGLPYYGNGTGYGNSSSIAVSSRTISPGSSVRPTYSSSVSASSPSSSPGSSTYSNSSSGYENAVYFTNWFVCHARLTSMIGPN